MSGCECSFVRPEANLILRVPQGAEIEAAYAILRDRFYWGRSRGLPDDGLMSFSSFMERQEQGQNFALFHGRQVVGTVGLRREETAWDYRALMPPGEHWWIHGLATHLGMAGRGLGGALLERVSEYLISSGAAEVYLDCLSGNGYLPKFYLSNGFELLGRQTVEEAGGGLVQKCVFGRCLSLSPAEPVLPLSKTSTSEWIEYRGQRSGA